MNLSTRDILSQQVKSYVLMAHLLRSSFYLERAKLTLVIYKNYIANNKNRLDKTSTIEFKLVA